MSHEYRTMLLISILGAYFLGYFVGMLDKIYDALRKLLRQSGLIFKNVLEKGEFSA